jgi:hypothetical protein
MSAEESGAKYQPELPSKGNKDNVSSSDSSTLKHVSVQDSVSETSSSLLDVAKDKHNVNPQENVGPWPDTIQSKQFKKHVDLLDHTNSEHNTNTSTNEDARSNSALSVRPGSRNSRNRTPSPLPVPSSIQIIHNAQHMHFFMPEEVHRKRSSHFGRPSTSQESANNHHNNR